MRRLADATRIAEFMRRLGQTAAEPGQVYFAGGATAVLFGWRDTTMDVDLKLVPDQDSVLRAIPSLKESLELNVELATPDDFIPVPATWQARSPFVAQEGRLTFRHFDLSAQALAKIERGHAQDLADVDEMIGRGLVTGHRLEADFAAIEPELHRYPAVDPRSFRRAVEAVLARLQG
jgi:hypothetical protein